MYNVSSIGEIFICLVFSYWLVFAFGPCYFFTFTKLSGLIATRRPPEQRERVLVQNVIARVWSRSDLNEVTARRRRFENSRAAQR